MKPQFYCKNYKGSKPTHCHIIKKQCQACKTEVEKRQAKTKEILTIKTERK